MNLSELRTFLTIAETGSLIRASESLNVTQSTVTARLKSLEAEVGQALIIRKKSGASLTAAGVRLKRYAETISDLWRQARQETSLPGTLNSVCNIGCHPDLWPGLCEIMFDYVRGHVPEAALSVWQGGQSDMANWLDDGLIDLSVTYWPSARQNQDIIPIYQDRLVLVSTRKGSPVRFDPDYVFIEAGEEFGREHAAVYADANTARISFGTACMGLEYLLKNGGSAYLPQRMVRSQVDSGILFELEDAPVFERSAFLVINKRAREMWTWFDDCINSFAHTRNDDASGQMQLGETFYSR